jgi:peptidoglycan/xylan/chitin deacetylase (PgdA/CDA1 family)
MLTFDDGGVSAYNETADLIESYNWCGHFFIVTDFIGLPGYLTKAHVRELRQRGHVIGSHTCSHPYPISRLPLKSQRAEWCDSLDKLTDILGEKVNSGAFPGGDFSVQAAIEASKAGVRYLFTLEPTNNTWMIEDCVLIGRYLMRRNTSPAKAAALASGKMFHRWSRWLTWNAKKVPKHIAGKYYDQLKVLVVER